MRREMQEIIPGLFLGPFAAALPKNVSTYAWDLIDLIDCGLIFDYLLFLSFLNLDRKVENLKAKNISEIVCVRSVISTGETNEGFFIKPRMPNQFNYLTLNISDSVTENIIPFFDQFYDWVSDRLSRNLSVLVHGNTGMSRSAALVISFVMRHFDYTSEEAISFVQRKRFCLFLNDGFKAQLREYEPIWKANQRKSEEHASEHETSLKRSFSQTAL